MIPAVDDLWPGSDPRFVEQLRARLSILPRIVGVVTLTEHNRVISHRPWEMTPVPIALKFFDMPLTADSFDQIVAGRIEVHIPASRGEFVERPDMLVGPDGRCAVVNVIADKSFEEISRLLELQKA